MCDEVFDITPKTSQSSTQIDTDTPEIENSELVIILQKKLAKAEMSIATLSRDCSNKESTIIYSKQELELKNSQYDKLAIELAQKSSIIKNLQITNEEEVLKRKYLVKENKEYVNLLENRLQVKDKDLKAKVDEIKNLNIQLEDQRKEIVEKLNILNKLQSERIDEPGPLTNNTTAKSENNSSNPSRKISFDTTLEIEKDELDSNENNITIIDKQTGKKVKAMTLGERIKQFTMSQESNDCEDLSRSYTIPSRRAINPRRCQKFSDSTLLSDKTGSNPNISSEPNSPNVTGFKANMSKTLNKFSSCANLENNKCVECGKTTYPVEKIVVDKLPYHKKCFKCSVCKTPLRPGKHAGYQGTIFCTNHFKQNFLVKGGKYPDQIRPKLTSS